MISNIWISCILRKWLKSKEIIHVNWNFAYVGLRLNISLIYLLSIVILPKLTFYCWLITDDNALLAIQVWLKDFPWVTNDVRKVNATWSGGSTVENLLQDANLNHFLMCKSSWRKCLFPSLPSKWQQYCYQNLDLKILPWHLLHQEC